MPAGRIRCGRQCNRQHKVSTPRGTTGGTPCDKASGDMVSNMIISTTSGTPRGTTGDMPRGKASGDMVSNMIISTTSDTPCDTTGGTPRGAASKAAGKSAVNYSAQDAR